MSQNLFLLIIIAILIIVLGISKYLNLNTSILRGGVIEFGGFSLGGKMPLGEGATTFAPELHIPPSKFYLGIVQKSIWCALEDCGVIGNKVAALGGWLQGENANQPEIKEDFGLNDHVDVSSIVIVGNKHSVIVGIYPDKTMDDVAEIMEIHRDLWQ